MSIRQLPDDVVGKIKSSVVITSLNGVAIGLLKNSLDAGANKVNITIDYTRGNCTVEDNGLGVPPDEFREDGGLGKLHHTSRYPPSDGIYGKQGDFLASLATLSLLLVSSRHHRHISHNSVLFHNSTVLARHLPAPPEHVVGAFDRGTRVVVRDLFGLMPVRVKQRTVVSSDRLNAEKEWNQFVQDIVAVLLAWNGNTSVFLRETTSKRELRLKPPDGSDLLSRASRLLTQASLADSGHANSWVPLSASAGHVTVKGCLSTVPVASRRSQFISFGIQPITNEFGTNIIYEEVNKVFTNSSFGAIESTSKEIPPDKPNNESSAGKDLRARKGIERWPMFYLRVRLRDTGSLNAVDDILDNRNSELSTVLDLLKAVCYGFLKKQHHRPRKVRMTKEESLLSIDGTKGRAKRASEKGSLSDINQQSSHSSSSSRAGAESRPASRDSPFDGWQRIKVGYPTRLAQRKQEATELHRQHEDRLIGDGGQLLRKPFQDLEEEERQGHSGHFSQISASQCSQSQPAVEIQTQTKNRTPPFSPTQPNEPKRKKLERRPDIQPSEWLQDVLRSWNNPIFENPSPAIPRAYDETPMTAEQAQCALRSRHFAGDGDDCNTMFESASVNLSGRISKTALLHAEVVSQVDKKFILVKLPLDDVRGSMQAEKTCALVVLDQHAADERCRLERLMADYFRRGDDGVLMADAESLERPIIFEVNAKEGDLLTRYQSHFEVWGICYQMKRDRAPERPYQVNITTLPPSIFERCRTEPRLIIELLRREIWKLAETSRPPPAPSTHDGGEHPWVPLFNGCPRGILELLHSRACRSAIMFNDVLTKPKCEELLWRVSRCAFPFQCAHGRPSMAPLVDLGTGSRIGGWDGDKGFAQWKSWMQ